MKLLRDKLKTLLPDLFVWIIMIIILIVLFVVIIALFVLFGGAIMVLLGLEYDSIWSIILFFVISSAISFPLDIFIEALPKALVEIGKLSIKQAKALSFIENTIIGIIVLGIVDFFMGSISASLLSIIVISVIMSILSLFLDDDSDYNSES